MKYNKIEGVVERYGPSLTGHGDHGFSVLLVGSDDIFTFPSVREAYSPEIGSPSNSSSTLVELMAPGDNVSFEIRNSSRVMSGSLRNWTLEHRLYGTEIDITPIRLMLDAPDQFLS